VKKAIFIFIAVWLAVSCEKNEKICNCDNPVEDLPWLKELKNSFTNCACQISIVQATWDKQPVFYSIMNDPLCNGSQEILLFDCSGALLKSFSMTDDSFRTEVTNRKILYVCNTKK
jgi:hypothetical protein